MPDNICNNMRTRMEIAGFVAVTAADTEAVRADIVESMAAMLRSLQSNIQNVAERQNDMSSSVNATSGSLSVSNGRFKTWMWGNRMHPVLRFHVSLTNFNEGTIQPMVLWSFV